MAHHLDNKNMSLASDAAREPAITFDGMFATLEFMHRVAGRFEVDVKDVRFDVMDDDNIVFEVSTFPDGNFSSDDFAVFCRNNRVDSQVIFFNHGKVTFSMAFNRKNK